ncbi:hypothetical protein ATORI0001_1411 [Lancefieldella rimae ATCC 49626]|uniref:Uncharacterized protein n=1 Tax=Lancefieldella rimae (strain ATCC 49626 / DSM 7090 / CCUG 31168 / NBRC 15546 / VPI D140H-11A) TaxID=553184 RepID=B9CM72_LANR4|nr:hypothetical protein ATORI0001_1411 [Lancefieldella rimae ATCC 49626]
MLGRKYPTTQLRLLISQYERSIVKWHDVAGPKIFLGLATTFNQRSACAEHSLVGACSAS